MKKNECELRKSKTSGSYIQKYIAYTQQLHICFFFISKIYRKGAKGRNPKYTGCIQETPKEQGKENNCLRNQNRNNHV